MKTPIIALKPNPVPQETLRQEPEPSPPVPKLLDKRAFPKTTPQGTRPNPVQINQIGAFPGAESLISLFKLLKLFSRVNLTERY
ncbi:MAG: hypothetical protein HC851_17540 [Acaryochloris sp. RU_4_1]|nr:hypothetical protein [Acaryochloris sp. RU_4_1]